MSYKLCSIQWLTRLFPYLNKEYLTNKFIENNQSFSETFYFIQEIIGFNIQWITSNNKYKYDRKSKLKSGLKLYTLFNDEMLNFKYKDLSDVYKIFLNLIVPNFNNQLSIEIEKLAESYLSQNAIKCECCDDYSEFDEMVSCTNAHLFCKKCFIKYVETIVYGQNKSEIKCMCFTEICNGSYTESLLYSTLPEKLYTKLQYIEIQNSDFSNIKGLHNCRNCYETYIVESDILTCIKCNTKTCVLCNDDQHQFYTCEEYKTKKEYELSEDGIRLKIEEKITNGMLRKCPTCKKSIVKESGCNKMTCSCGTIFCYICDNKIQNYSHFCTILCIDRNNCNKCHLYDDDNDKRLENIKNEIIDADFNITNDIIDKIIK